MYFLTNTYLAEAQPVCEPAEHRLEQMESLLKIFKKETEKTYSDPKRIKDLGSLIVGAAQDIAGRLSDYMDEGCCEDALKDLEAKVRALPWTFQQNKGSKVVRIERFGDIIAAHRILIEALKRAQQTASSHARCNAPSP